MRVQVVKDKNDQVITEDVKVRVRFREYFDELLNFEEERGNRVINRRKGENAFARRFA